MSTFGNTDTRVNYATGIDNWKIGIQAALPVAGEVSKLSFYVDNLAAGHMPCHIKGTIYNDTGSNTPGTLKATTPEIAVDDSLALGWLDATFSASVSCAAGNYWLCIMGCAHNAGDTAVGFRLYRQTGLAGQPLTTGANPDTYSDGPEDPFDTITPGSTIYYCIYGTYTASAAFSGLTVTKLIQG